MPLVANNGQELAETIEVPSDPVRRRAFLDGAAYGYVIGRDAGYKQGVDANTRMVKRLLRAVPLSQAVSPAG